MLSSRAKYGVRAAALLAEHASDGSWVQAAEIAVREHIPRKFLEAILVELRDNAIIESRRGARGGHRLLRDPATISVADIIRVIDGPLALTPCASATRFSPCTDCNDIASCKLKHVMRQARDAVAGVLEGCSLASLAAMEASPPEAGTTGAGTTEAGTTEAGTTEAGTDSRRRGAAAKPAAARARGA